LPIKTKIVSSYIADSKPVKQEVNGTVILPPLVFPDAPFTLTKSTSKKLTKISLHLVSQNGLGQKNRPFSVWPSKKSLCVQAMKSWWNLAVICWWLLAIHEGF